jgi:alkanesulfonate monooxygenase SsuD/methylene tetrahydromethanopterin reductase-like flavin-dependent oxidoreductase (luciferase family)
VPVEFIGIARTADRSETIAEAGPAVQPDYLYGLARAHEQSGFDRVLVAHSSSSPDGFTVADQVLNATTRLGVVLAHRPGFVAPTIAARKFATIAAFHPGRIALHVITGGDDGDQARDGDFSDKATRYRRTDEFLDVVELGGRRTGCRARRGSGPSRPSPIRCSCPRWPRGGSSPWSGWYQHGVPGRGHGRAPGASDPQSSRLQVSYETYRCGASCPGGAPTRVPCPRGGGR